MKKIKNEWYDPLMKCFEKTFVVDEKTKKIIWTNVSSIKEGDYCYHAFFEKDSPCEVCPALQKDRLYQWERYDENNSKWYNAKHYLFFDEGQALRAVNLNAIDDTMRLNYDSIEHISELQILLDENLRIKKSLEREVSHDRMTGLFNRNKFNSDMTADIFDCDGLGVLYFDLNNLKTVNDLYRHEAGDRIIKCLADSIAETTAEFENAFAYRVGGDEFVIMFAKCTEDILKQAHASFAQHLNAKTSNPPCIVAIGEAYSANSCDAEKLVSKADSAMYADKLRIKSGK